MQELNLVQSLCHDRVSNVAGVLPRCPRFSQIDIAHVQAYISQNVTPHQSKRGHAKNAVVLDIARADSVL